MFYKFIVVVTFLLCQLSSNYISKMGEFYFKYTDNKPYLNGNQKKNEDIKDLPDDPGARTLCFHCSGTGLILG